MLIEKLYEERNYTHSEAIIKNYILEHLDDFYTMTADELSRETYTSKATVIRFCKKVTKGKGFQEFKLMLLAEAESIREIRRKKRNIAEDFLQYNAGNVVSDIYYMAETTGKMAVDGEQIAEITKRILQADFIDLFGTGVDLCYARGMAYKLRRLEIFATALDDLYEYNLEEKNKRKIAMVFGLQKPLAYIENLTVELKQREYYIITFIDDQNVLEEGKFIGNIVFPIKANQILTESMKVIFYEMVLNYILDTVIINLEKCRKLKQKVQKK